MGFIGFCYTTNKEAYERGRKRNNIKDEVPEPTIGITKTKQREQPRLPSGNQQFAILAPCVTFRTTDKAKGPLACQITVALRLCLFFPSFISFCKLTKRAARTDSSTCHLPLAPCSVAGHKHRVGQFAATDQSL